MAQYVCSLCGYVYDEEREGVMFDTLPDNWKCPLCGAAKGDFEKKKSEVKAEAPIKKEKPVAKEEAKSEKSFTNAELNTIFTNLAKGCEKQYMTEEAELFALIAEYYKKHIEPLQDADSLAISKLLKKDLSELYPNAFASAKEDDDRGALRALTWNEKVSKILNTLLERYKKEGSAFVANKKIFVCEICGFIYIGDEAPDVCPICKVPKLKIHEVRRA